ncbi:MAG: UDP-3-O-(3-hydroxymyristoyl)glucosamine N-acyltransferase [Pseudomonadota bacterium]
MPIPVRSAPLTLLALAQHCQAESVGDSSFKITGLNTLERASPSELIFVAQAKYMSRLQHTRAQAIILPAALREQLPRSFHCIIHPQPQLAFSTLCELFYRPDPIFKPGTHPTALVDTSAMIDPTASIGAFAVVGVGAWVGAGTRIDAHSVIGEGVRIGKNGWVGSHVSIYHHCEIGDRVRLHNGVVIGSDGFGWLPNPEGIWQKVPQVGRVILGNDVDIGAVTTIDRGALDDTVIADGVKLDNHIQIAHNVKIGAHTVIAACTGIAGSTRVGQFCRIGGAAMIVGHIDIADHTTISGGTLLSYSVTEPHTVQTGYMPADEHRAFLKNARLLRRLDELEQRIKQLEKSKV